MKKISGSWQITYNFITQKIHINLKKNKLVINYSSHWSLTIIKKKGTHHFTLLNTLNTIFIHILMFY